MGDNTRTGKRQGKTAMKSSMVVGSSLWER